MKYKNMLIIGTSHIARQSLEEIEAAFKTEAPSIVAVELDKQRLHSLMSNQKSKVSIRDISRIGLKGYLFAVIGGMAQKKLGSLVGMQPGSEMKLAVELARKANAKIALIDQDIEITLKKFSQRLSWKEKFRFISDIFKSIFLKEKAIKELGIGKGIDLSKVPEKELVRKLMQQLRERYPNVYDVLVRQRNVVMANNISRLMHQYPDEKMLVVVGAGHETDIVMLVRRRMEGKADVI